MKIALMTAPPAEAESLARRLVAASLAACVNVVPGGRSIYRWKGEIETEDESILIAKIRDDDADAFVGRAVEWHSYECPECILIDVEGGNPAYLAWVDDPAAGA